MDSNIKKDEFITEDKFEKKYFGYIIKRIKLDTVTAGGNQKFKVFVGREGEVLFEHIMIRYYSKQFNKFQNAYTAKPYNLDLNNKLNQAKDEKMAKEAELYDSMMAVTSEQNMKEALKDLQ